MLVLSREAGTSIVIDSPYECVVTVLKLLHKQSSIAIQVSRASTERPGKFDQEQVELGLIDTYQICDGVELRLVDLRGDKARIGIIAPKEAQVHRKEVYDAIRRENRAAAGERRPDPDDDGPAGSPVPRPSSPKPPTLDVRLNEPRPSSEDYD